LRTSSSHEEGAERDFAVATKRFEGKDGKVESLTACHVEWVKDEKGGMAMKEVPGTEFTIPAQLVLLAMGYLHPVHEGLIEQLGVAKDPRGNVKAATEGNGSYATSVAKVFAAGDMRRGQSLVVWAIREGRQCAREVDAFLMGSSDLPR
jgi:glutamate synthase (NADPH/NADH) small chain